MKKPHSSESQSAADSKADVLLRESLYVMEPLARLMVANGVTYTTFSQALKRVFLEAAEAELNEGNRKITDSALSLLSGVHRKDVRSLAARRHEPAGKATSIADQVIQRWIALADYVGADGVPKPLPIRGFDDDRPSFERLAHSVSKDFHARSILDELVRLGVVAVENNEVRIISADGFLPGNDMHESLRIFGATLRDHVAAAHRNLTATQSKQRPPFLEYSVWADELSAQSTQEIAHLAQKCWFTAMRQVTDLALELSERDRADPGASTAMRFRFGGFTYHEPMSTDGPVDESPRDPGTAINDKRTESMTGSRIPQKAKA